MNNDVLFNGVRMSALKKKKEKNLRVDQRNLVPRSLPNPLTKIKT